MFTCLSWAFVAGGKAWQESHAFGMKALSWPWQLEQSPGFAPVLGWFVSAADVPSLKET